MTNSSGTTVWQGEFKPFGEPLSVSGSITNNLRFPGQYYDSDTGLHQNWHRDYKAEIGRYVEADPIGIKKGQNHLYSYVANSPINSTDFLGLVASFCSRIAFTSGESKKGTGSYPGANHCYFVANGKIFSWHPNWNGGVNSDEYPASNSCTELHCGDKCDKNKDKELEDCIYQSGLALGKNPGWLWLAPIWDCCDVTKTVIRNCQARLGCKVR